MQKLFGELNYIAGLSRPDIAFSINKIARRLNNPSKEVFRCAKRILSYIASSSSLGLKNTRNDNNTKEIKLIGYSDASFADIDTDKFKSSAGFIILLNGTPISWKSKKIRYICTNTGESEYLALFIASKEMLFLGHVLIDLYDIDLFPLTLFSDNKAVYDVLHGNRSYDLTKYMATKYLKLQEWVNDGLLNIQLIKSKENIADGLTKIGKQFASFQQSVLYPRGSVTPEFTATSNLTNDDDERHNELGRTIRTNEEKTIGQEQRISLDTRLETSGEMN